MAAAHFCLVRPSVQRFVLLSLAVLTSCVSVAPREQLSLSEGDFTVFFVSPPGWLGSRFDPRGFYEFYPERDFSRLALTIAFSDLRPEDLASLPETDRSLFEQNSLAERYVRRERREGFTSTGITMDSATSGPKSLRIYLSVSNVSRFLTFIPYHGHVVQICMYSPFVADLVAHRATYVQFLSSIHPQ